MKKAAAKKSSPKSEPAAGELSAGDLAALAELEQDAQSSEPADDGEIRPVIIGKKDPSERPVEQVTIFELDDVEYGIPKEPSAALVLKYLFDWRNEGRGLALEAMAVTLLGPANLAALAASPDVGEDDIKGVFANVGTVFFGSKTYRSIMESAGN